MSFKSNILVAAAAAMSWCAAPAALSQEPPTGYTPASPDLNEQAQPSQDIDEATAPAHETTPSQSTADAGAIDDRKIEQFADAYIAVQTIQQKASAELQSAPDSTAADKVKTKAESEMVAAVERSGLQVDEFNQIVETMASNVEVRNKVAAKLQERSGG
jgi:hypothetical protein